MEGSINTTRNILNERAHSLLDQNLNARKTIKSAVKASAASCCFEYDVSDREYLVDWNNSYGESKKSVLHLASPFQSTAMKDADSDSDSSADEPSNSQSLLKDMKPRVKVKSDVSEESDDNCTTIC